MTESRDIFRMPPARFMILSADIRHNCDELAVLDVGDNESVFSGVVTLRGWQKGSAEISYCSFIRDETLAPGTMVITPKPSRDILRRET